MGSAFKDSVPVDLKCGCGPGLSFLFPFYCLFVGDVSKYSSFLILESTGYTLRFTGPVWGLSKAEGKKREEGGREEREKVAYITKLFYHLPMAKP